MNPDADTTPGWYAIRTHSDHHAEQLLTPEVNEIYFPKETILTTAGTPRTRPIIPHLLFIHTTRAKALQLEKRSHDTADRRPPLWIYRTVRGEDPRPISQREITLFKLLTAPDATRCEIFNKTDFRSGQRVRITGGIFAGHEGHIKRVRRNKHVIVEIEGICAIMLPFIHPDLLTPINTKITPANGRITQK